MTESSKEAIERACEMLSCSTAQSHLHPVMPVARFIQEVSDAATQASAALDFKGLGATKLCNTIRSFILPDPEPDVLAEALSHCATMPGVVFSGSIRDAEMIRTELAKRGYEISKVSE